MSKKPIRRIPLKKINKTDQKGYHKYLSTYLSMKEGQNFTLHILTQLIDGFEIDRKGRICNVVIDDSPIYLDLED